ncbi:MAG: DUF1549 domain-containing protein [Gemmataceae bacterium]|nr:DUF1549 domain-containing protein [Gemmataceae bacterium]
MLLLPLFAMALAHGNEPLLSFEKDIRPIFKAYCFDCHGAHEKPKSGLDLRQKRFAVRGGKTGAGLQEKDPDKSHLLQRMKSGEMPPVGKKVSADQIALVEQWILQGATTLRPEPDSLAPGIGITEDERNYWFFKPLIEPAAPLVKAQMKVRNPIDAFILAGLEKKNLGLNPEAPRRTLIRRAYFDLTGLPPTLEQVEQFEKDASPRAYENLIDTLLASPAYGERWARHWLDAAGYADTEGDAANDTARPYLYKYRDYLVRSLNQDKPWDRCIIEQLAGDELAPKPWDELPAAEKELLAATGFLRCGPDFTASGGGREEAEQTFTETLKITSSALLGLSVGCAQCHDHRYDPVSQEDYFRFRAIFEPAFNPAQWRRPGERQAALLTKPEREKSAQIEKEAQELAKKHQESTAAAIKTIFAKELEKVPDEMREPTKKAFDTAADKRTGEQKTLVEKNPKLNISPGLIYQYDTKVDEELKKMQAGVDAKRAGKPKEDFFAVTNEPSSPAPATRLHHRGDFNQPKQTVAAGDLAIATVHQASLWNCPEEKKGESSGRRLAFAKHLTSGNHAQFNRVMANRFWLHHFGQGLVDTPGEFGKLGVLPAHPELLDWLACQLPKNQWRLKVFHQLIMTSAVYRQSSAHRPAHDAVDNSNHLYGRYPLRRLEAEALRDSMLKVNQRLDLTLFGPAIALKEDASGVMHYPADQPRRTLYMQVRRHKPSSFLQTFDGPGLAPNCDKRVPSAGTPQALALMNGEFIRQEAGNLAALLATRAVDEKPRLTLAWQLVYQRTPTASEIKLVENFLQEAKATYLATKAKDPAQLAWTDLCQQLFASNEFLYLE